MCYIGTIFCAKVIPGCQNLRGYWAPGHRIVVHTSEGKSSNAMTYIIIIFLGFLFCLLANLFLLSF